MKSAGNCHDIGAELQAARAEDLNSDLETQVRLTPSRQDIEQEATDTAINEADQRGDACTTDSSEADARWSRSPARRCSASSLEGKFPKLVDAPQLRSATDIELGSDPSSTTRASTRGLQETSRTRWMKTLQMIMADEFKLTQTILQRLGEGARP